MKNTKEINIFTHDGIFHADEVCAVALLKYYLHADTNITRTRDKRKISVALEDLKIFVIDIGGVHKQRTLCFDHHQSQDKPASNMLVFDWLIHNNHINTQVANQLHSFLQGISDIDTNNNYAVSTWRGFNSDGKYRNVSNIISGFNTDPNQDSRQYLAFHTAIDVMYQILSNEIRLAEQRLHEHVILTNADVINNRVLLMDEYCTIWKDRKQSSYEMAIMPHPQGWQVMSRDSDQHPLVDVLHKEGLVFMHASKFMCVFKEKEQAINYAMLEL